ncbi:MAG TPA: hypothetical protein PKB10_12210 [Tepidisphaeraceae bacterium]|nr:hypothetical protein [Tepidisphaeraceae bacterium]
MGRFAIALLIGGGVLAWFGWKEYRLASACKPEVNRVTCAQLATHGPGDNANVEMSDFAFTNNYVYREAKGDSSKYAEAWVPAMPLESDYIKRVVAAIQAGGAAESVPLPSSEIRVIVKLKNVTSSDMDSFAQRDTLSGLVINEIESISGKQKSLLSESYPGIDLNQCYILELNRKPMSSGASMG